MKNIIVFILLIQFSYAIGLRSLVIPQNAEMLGSSSTGISSHHQLNPANLSQSEGCFSFSRNNWYADIDGQKVSILFESKNFFDKSFISMESLSVKDIELRNEIANDSPIGFFGVYWYAIEFAQNLSLGKYNANFSNTHIGYRLKTNLSKLYTSTMYGYTFDLGITSKINDNIKVSFIMKDFGKEFSDDLNASLSEILGFGFNYNIPAIYLTLLSDIYYQNNDFILKYSLKTNFPYINFFTGVTKSNDYSDFAYGLMIELNKWSLVYGSLNHDKAEIGNPTSIELRKTF